ncbi:Petrobactin biosynthesis protein AsbE [Bacillus sp. Xin]|uniref:DUF6005 family protein n=1 Tax=unclassified Bacillus (in: firmicutes) TaxID=185979 RepID=UPI001572F3A9|nr:MULTISPECIES: DUF6005 family protein [unclassified Bacillus (in: firmicutes)]MBC6972268.1 Petrobactin biosynthesis protein AsbE [Bacillus sp. Xin]NSW38165.1 Petrobactin biosynthesis protein AsbE [Bacillus sp. Xin1]
MTSIKVHCLVSCFCEIIKRRSDIDFRPFYFGLWDGDFDITEEGVISYHSENISHDSYLHWYEKLYGIKVNEWYDHSKEKQTNVETFLELVETKPENRYVIVMVDMSLLPERENKFHQKPFPHYLMISKTNQEDEWFMLDPDFRWEGNMAKDKVIHSIENNPFGGGYFIDVQAVREPSQEAVESYFVETFKRDYNELTMKLKDLVIRMVNGEGGAEFSKLIAAVKQIPVLAIRKYSYEHAFAYFRETLQYSETEFDYWCDRVEDIVQGFTNVQYKVIKMAMTKNKEMLSSIVEKLNEMNEIEFAIKQELERQFVAWKKIRINQSVTL